MQLSENVRKMLKLYQLYSYSGLSFSIELKYGIKWVCYYLKKQSNFGLKMYHLKNDRLNFQYVGGFKPLFTHSIYSRCYYQSANISNFFLRQCLVELTSIIFILFKQPHMKIKEKICINFYPKIYHSEYPIKIITEYV